uniref:CUB domain-containing protein n=1 Tax=Wuchereria bancrofti TaxID=6293 RepID=A0AAF5PYG6_WUCBA
MNVAVLLLAFMIGITKSTEGQQQQQQQKSEKSQKICETQEIHGKEVSGGYLTSPNYPFSYPSNQDCLFNITASANLVIHLTFTHFHLEDRALRSNQCLNDYVIVTVVDYQGREHIGERFCGNQLPEPLHTMQNSVYIRFHSSHTNEYSGFRLRYQFLTEESIFEPASSYFDDDLRYLRYCGGHSNRKTFNGEIRSPGYPSFYPKNVTCNWLLRVDPGKKIYIRVQYLELSPTMAECDKASVYIIDGYRHDSTTDIVKKDDASQVKFCGSQLYYTEEGMKSYMSTGNRLIVRFVTKGHPSPSLLTKYEKQGKPIGFRLIWTEVENILPEGNVCPGFACKGGELCIDDGQNVCASRTQLCIDKSLICNGVYNCAENDYTDEEDCYSQHIIISICSIIFILIIFIISVFLWQRKIRRRVEEHKRKRLEAATIGSASLADSNGKNTVIWEATRCSSMNVDPSLDIHHLHPGHYQSYCHHYHNQQKQHEQQQQNHIALSEMNTFHSALL